MYNDFAGLCREAESNGAGLWRAALDREVRGNSVSEDDVLAEAARCLDVMKESCRFTESHDDQRLSLVGDITLKQRAYADSASSLCGRDINDTMADALACIQSDYHMGRICAMPTAGSCGIVPAVLFHTAKKTGADDESLIRALITAGGVGALAAEKATISGAAGGCQAECGVAAMMAAVAAAEMCGAEPQTALAAGAFAMINAMGLVCDPVAGLIQVPCVYRNASQAVNALLSVDLAMAGNRSFIPLDEVVEAMYEVGRKMAPEFRETAIGGLAGTDSAKKVKNP